MFTKGGKTVASTLAWRVNFIFAGFYVVCTNFSSPRKKVRFEKDLGT